MTCRGENYDVDQSVLNGCERVHPTPPGHTTATASSRGNKPCSDAASLDTFSLNGFLSDSRVHQNPVVDGFNAVVGSAPDYWWVVADGGICINDYAITFTTTGGSAASCYTLSFITNKLTATATVSGAGTATISFGGSAYSSGTTVYFKIEKTCSLPVQEAVSYTVQYHL